MVKKKTELALSRDLMYEGIESKIEGFRWKEENKFRFNQNNNAIEVHAISQEKELRNLLNFNYENNCFNIDNDRIELTKLTQKLVSTIVSSNNKGIIPGHILLQARIDFPQSYDKNRTSTIVNKIGFNKQILKNSFFDRRKLTQSEIALWAISRNLELPNNLLKKHIKYIGDYFSKIDYFNLNKQTQEGGIIESGWFKDITNPAKYKTQDNCYFCSNPSIYYDHDACKKTNTYLSTVIKRSAARYHKRFIHNDAQLNENERNEFEIVEVKKDFLKNHSSNRVDDFKPYYIARIKNTPL